MPRASFGRCWVGGTEAGDPLRQSIWSVAVLWLLWLGVAQADLTETIERVRPSVVGIGSLQPTRSPQVALFGTGFVVADGRHVVTNAHVLDTVLDVDRNEGLRILVGRGPRPQMRRASKVAVDRAHDLVLLRFEGAPLPPLRLAEREIVREGTDLAFTGFPIGAVLGLYPSTHRAMVSAVTPIVAPKDTEGQLTAEVIKRLRSPYDVLQLDAIAYPGNSGSPLYEPGTGRVVGVINMVFVKETRENVLEHPSAIAYAIPIRYVHDLLSEAGTGVR